MQRNRAAELYHYPILLLFLLVLLVSCGHKQSKEHKEDNPNASELPVSYAQGFTISELDNGYELVVSNPWQDAKNVQYKYLLCSNTEKTSGNGYSEVIPIPAKRVVCLSTTHIAYIDRLGACDVIVGVSGADYVSNTSVQNKIGNGLVKDVGYEQALNYELLVSLKPDVVLAYGVGAEMAGYLQKLKDLRIPVVFVGDYLEENPLGKAEWLKVFGLLLGKYQQADSLFGGIAQEYNQTKAQLPVNVDKPKVFLNLPWKDVWYFPGGRGYMANLIADAGGDYVLNHLQGSKSYPFSIENALEYAAKSEIWLNTGMANSISEIESELPIVKGLPVLSAGNVFNNNNRVNPTGGNDFWESGVVNPHIILKDLIEILYPQNQNHQLVYYKQLQ
jgi:iron complex transport system substrate-binding protein